MDYFPGVGVGKNDAVSWQDLLNLLTIEASKNGLLNKVLNLRDRNEFEIVDICLSYETLRCQLMQWMESLLDSEVLKKSSAMSTHFRTRGNEEFKLRHDEASLSLYTDCVRFAPSGSQELALGFANRSATLFHLHHYQESAQDAKRALSLPYPENLHLKLLLRLARCYLCLQEWNTFKVTLDLASENFLKNRDHMTDTKICEVTQELDSLHLELRKKESVSYSDVLNHGTSCVELPSLLSGLNEQFPCASNALELRYSPLKGRYVVTKQPVKQGDVLFIEKPYAFVVLPDQFKSHCHHCTQKTIAPIPCRSCTDILFCSDSCEEKALASYHLWECHGIPLMSAVGVAHLGLRIIAVTGTAKQLLEREPCSTNIETFGTSNDCYSGVYALLPHITNMDVNDIFQYSATAMLLALYLQHRTDYFTGTVATSDRGNTPLHRVCAALLRHITQLVCNAHAITKLDSPSESVPTEASMNNIVLETQQRVATAIYPSASMMNHSCDPNIINSFYNEILIVKASRDIPKGHEVFNCYGPHFKRMGIAERQALLLAQYFFFCKCTACEVSSGETYDPAQERLFALKCSACEGPLIEVAPGREPAGSKTVLVDSSNSHLMLCDSCGIAQPISSMVQDVFQARILFRRGCEDMETGHVQEALAKLRHCEELQKRSLYRRHKDLTETYDSLGKCYAMLGHYEESIECLKLILPTVEEQYGESSIEVAHELQKLSDVMMCHLLSLKETPSKKVLFDTDHVIKRAQKILLVQYGEWNQGWQDLKRKADQLDKLINLAGCGSDMDSVQKDLNAKLNLNS